MAFQPHVDQVLTIERVPYRIATHPSAPGMAYGQEGRQGIVYQLLAEDGTKKALKVFKPRFRVPALVSLSERLAPWATLPGLQVCDRVVLTAYRHAELLRTQPDLIYAVLMPWVVGPTWMQVLLEKRDLQAEDCLTVARHLASVLARMEEQGLAHCDLSGPNVLLPSLSSEPSPHRGEVALVDVEQFYAPDLRRPPTLPGGSPGYAHRTAPEGLWAPDADRFAGAVLLAEMLGWCDERVRAEAWGESYFDPAEVQADCRRYSVLVGVLQERWGGAAAALFERAWRSDTLSDCATFGEWLLALPEQVGGAAPSAPLAGLPQEPEVREQKVEQPQPVPAADADLHAARELIALGQRLVGQGQRAAALSAYLQAQVLAQGSTLAGEVALLIAELQTAAPAAPPPTAEHDGDEAELARLFDAGAAACEQSEWQRAVELLAEVVRRWPGYARGGKRAQELLERARAQAERQGKRGPRPRGKAGLLVLLGCGVLLALVLLSPAVTNLLMPMRAPTAAPVVPTVTAMPTLSAPTGSSLGLTLAPGVELELVRVPAGEFTMGSSDSDADALDDEKPWQTVYLDEYYMGRYEVTVAQFRAFVDATGYRTTAEQEGWAWAWTGEEWKEVEGANWRHPRGPAAALAADDHPVTQMSLDDAVAFCAWASQAAGRQVRLPTEAEWEKAARGTDGRRYPWGDHAPSDALCNYHMAVGGTTPVGRYSPQGDSPYGCSDMAGNVWEWTSSLHRPYPYAAGDGREEASSRDARVLRGGAFDNYARDVRAAFRLRGDPDYRVDINGFRVCVSPI